MNIKFGLIGASVRGLFLCWEAMKTPGVRLAAAADPSKISRANVKKVFGKEVETYGDAGKMLKAHPEISAVFIASNDASHYENIITALKFKKHIFAEKPLAQQIEHCDDILNRWKKSKVVFSGGLEFRHIYLSRTIKKLLDKKIIGNLAHITGVEYVPGGGMHNHPLYRRKETGRSLLLQKGVHDIDLLNWFSGGRPEWVFGAGGLNFYGGKKKKGLDCFSCPERKKCRPNIRKTKYIYYLDLTIQQKHLCAYAEDVDMEDNYQIVVGYDNNVRASFVISYNAPEYYHEFILVGDKGKLKGSFDHYKNIFRISYKLNESMEKETVITPVAFQEGGHGGGDSKIVKNFLDCLSDGSQPDADIYAARDAAVVAAGAQDSLESGKVVKIPPAGSKKKKR